MRSSATLTVRLPPELKRRLGRLARSTKRTQSYLAGAAIADFVARESVHTQHIIEGLQDLNAGRVVPHEMILGEIEAILGSAKRRKRRR
jgi:predicted transcriptional regulator